MTVTLTHDGFYDIPKNHDVQFEQFKKLAKQYECDCTSIGPKEAPYYIPTFVGKSKNMYKLIKNEFGPIKTLLRFYGLEKFEELDDSYRCRS